MASFTGKTVVVTGAAAGIGRELTLKLAAKGADLWALDLNGEALERVAHEGRKWGHTINTRIVDVTSLDELGKVRDEVVAARRLIHYWVNNAGINGTGPFLEMDAKQFDKILAVNLGGVVNGTRVALEVMEGTATGRIVNMASVAGHLPAPYMTAYNAGKFAVVGFTRSLQAELKLKSSPVSALLVSPGFVDTGIIDKGKELGFPDWLGFMLSKPADVAAAVVRAMPGRSDEIFPTFNGRLMRSMYRVFPKTTVKSSKIFLAKSLKDALLGRYENGAR